MDLICGKAEKELIKFKDSSIDALVSDIPYGVNINPIWDKGLPNEDIWHECYRILKPGAHCVIFGQPSMIHELCSVMGNTEFEYRDMWIWHYQGTHTKGYKIENGSFRSRIRNVFNPVFIYRKKIEGTEQYNWAKYKTNLFNIDENREQYKGNNDNLIKKFEKTGEKHFQSDDPSNTYKSMKPKGWVPDPRGAEPTNIKYITRVTRKERTINGLVKNTHETVKPIKLMMWLVGLVTSLPEQTVLDPFMGTGSTGCACKLLNRKFIGIDCNSDYVDIATKRIKYIDNIKDMFIN
ncbi:MAG: hypothetical protein DRO67_03650 [Candidatus Asgardarchaeum californiense]|nr:MAG: hypothetical protein DRO67_03650 [Candidatus Asgardarchaeum californiense]